MIEFNAYPRGTDMRAITLVATALLASAAQADTTPLAAPSIPQIDPSLVDTCTNADQAVFGSIASGLQDGYMVGEARFTGFMCKLRVHAGGAPEYRTFSGCGNVTWDLSGNIVSVSYRDVVPGDVLPAGC
jgi:hypothetical protein